MSISESDIKIIGLTFEDSLLNFLYYDRKCDDKLHYSYLEKIIKENKKEIIDLLKSKIEKVILENY